MTEQQKTFVLSRSVRACKLHALIFFVFRMKNTLFNEESFLEKGNTMDDVKKDKGYIFLDGFVDVVKLMSKNGIKAMDQLIEEPETGKKYVLTINEIRL